MTRSEQELSIVASLSCVPHDQPYEGPFRAARVRGQLPLNLVGVLVRIAGPLAAANVPIFAVSTFDTDYILVRADDRSRATQAWRAVGFDVVDSGATP